MKPVPAVMIDPRLAQHLTAEAAIELILLVLAIAVALARDPHLLLLDDPHAGLDASGRVLLDEIVAGAPAEGRTVMLASHELDLTRPLATREVAVVGGWGNPIPPNFRRCRTE